MAHSLRCLRILGCFSYIVEFRKQNETQSFWEWIDGCLRFMSHNLFEFGFNFVFLLDSTILLLCVLRIIVSLHITILREIIYFKGGSYMAFRLYASAYACRGQICVWKFYRRIITWDLIKTSKILVAFPSYRNQNNYVQNLFQTLGFWGFGVLEIGRAHVWTPVTL